ncbi:hypothetical protein FHS85_003495 [Rhodoligotrophos appendicifer]|uniref:hypothetical protein n=1 Tax=Rhodoligotrophos appendicifer TaxID=987056 RepID=UPI001186C343|nr:hypothetical protein [Rhodoligotrophos appendicifer]
MNTANLQLEGLYLAIAAVNRALVEKGLLTRGEVEIALRSAEEAALGDDRTEELSPANRDAIVFPLRLLQLANARSGDKWLSNFSEMAKSVGETKKPHNDQV